VKILRTMRRCTNSSLFPDMSRARNIMEQQRQRLLAKAIAQAAAEGDTAALKAHVDRLELLDKLSKAHSAHHDLRDGLLVTVFLAAALAMLLVVHLPAATEVAATVDSVQFIATSVELSGKATYGNGKVMASSRVQGSSQAGLADAQYLKLIGARLDSARIVMSLTRVGACDQLTVTQGSLYITLLNDSSGAASPSTLHMTATSGAPSSSLTLCGEPIEPILLKVRPVKLSLARDELFGVQQSDIEPVIKEGTVSLGYEKYVLTSSDLMYLEAASDRAGEAQSQLRVSSTAAGYLVKFSGRVKSLRFGGPNIRAERTPNVLEYLIKGSPWLSVYSALAAGIGLIWGIRKIIRGG
jgi:hypothetical protein